MNMCAVAGRIKNRINKRESESTRIILIANITLAIDMWIEGRTRSPHTNTHAPTLRPHTDTRTQVNMGSGSRLIHYEDFKTIEPEREDLFQQIMRLSVELTPLCKWTGVIYRLVGCDNGNSIKFAGRITAVLGVLN